MPSGSEGGPGPPLNSALPETEDGAPRFVLATLCLTQIVSWGVLFYAFPVMSPTIAADTGWSSNLVTGAFSMGLLVAAGAGIAVGRVIDRHGPHLVMTAGSVTATAAIILVAQAPNRAAFVAGWVLAGLAQAAVLYPPAFAALTRWYGAARVRALTTLTLVAGLASTVFAPATAALLEQFGWRQTYLVLGTVLAAFTIPAHALGLRAPWPRDNHLASAGLTSVVSSSGAIASIARSRPFLLLAVSLTLTAFGFGAATIGLVPLLTGRGWSESGAAWALGLIGLAQLLGRAGYPALTRRTQPRTRAMLVPLTSSLPLAVLAFTGRVEIVLFACAVLGMARGGFTLVESTATADRWGTRHFGTLYGLISAPVIIGLATSPWAGAVIADGAGGYSQLFALLAALTVVAAMTAMGTKPSGSFGEEA